MFGFDDFKNAAFITSLIVGCVFLPLFFWLYIRSKNGSHTNFDVSDRNQRKSVFYFVVPLLTAVIVILYATGQPENIYMGVFFGLVLIIVAQIVNYRVKSSLHVSLNTYLAFLIMSLDLFAGMIFLVFVVLIAWSRIVLGRHTGKEVLFGAAIGLIVGLTMLLTARGILLQK